jgi:hypothetical protein
MSGKGDCAGSIRLRKVCFQFVMAAARASGILRATCPPKFRPQGKKGIMRHALVVHADLPNPKSRAAGRSGARIACGVINASSGKDNDK